MAVLLISGLDVRATGGRDGLNDNLPQGDRKESGKGTSLTHKEGGNSIQVDNWLCPVVFVIFKCEFYAIYKHAMSICCHSMFYEIRQELASGKFTVTCL